MEPRYQCLSLGPVWSWRLLGSNHRELARARTDLSSFAAAAADALEVGAAAADAEIEVTVAAGSSWRWVMRMDGVERAAASISYARRLECLRAVARFRQCAPLAAVSTSPLRRRGAANRERRPAAQSPRDSFDHPARPLPPAPG